MDLTNKIEIKKMLKKYNAKPEKYFGQHFILSNNALKKMIESANIKKDDIIFEIGPGLGTLTKELAKTGAKITAVEKDFLMVGILKEALAGYENIKIIQADAKALLMSDINSAIDVRHQYKIVANLPYNAATFLIRQWLESEFPPMTMILMIQREVAQRICAGPPHSSLLGISVQFYADTEIIDYVKKESFWPKPKVNAAIIKIVPRKKSSITNREAFFKILKAGFSQPRKQLIGNFSKKLNIPREKIVSIFKNLDIPENARAENVIMGEWRKLSYKLIANP